MLKNHSNDEFLSSVLEKRKAEGLYRELNHSYQGIDFFSNDYLGLARSKLLRQKTGEVMENYSGLINGATGSRLLSGNSKLYEDTENAISDFHIAESALIFNSGYDANLGFFSCIPAKGDLIFYDELVHASIRDGIRLSHAESFSFLHNNVYALKHKISTVLATRKDVKRIFISLETIYSMDGDIAPIQEFVDLCKVNNYYLVADEAHATGVYGEKGEGMIASLGLEEYFFARLYTFGKAPGVHGAAICGTKILKEYLVNFCRPFIYSTALPPHSVAAINASYKLLLVFNNERENLKKLSSLFSECMNEAEQIFSPIKTIVIPGNNAVRKVAEMLFQKGFDVRPILSPTVAKGSERLRICLHSFNTEEEVRNLCSEIKNIHRN